MTYNLFNNVMIILGGLFSITISLFEKKKSNPSYKYFLILGIVFILGGVARILLRINS